MNALRCGIRCFRWWLADSRKSSSRSRRSRRRFGLAENLVLPDGEYAGQKIDFARVPHIAEPMDMLGPDSPANEVGVMKIVQSAFTTALLGVIGHRIDREPCDMLIVQPTDGALNDFNSTKLNRMIEATEPLGGKPDGRGGRIGAKIFRKPRALLPARQPTRKNIQAARSTWRWHLRRRTCA